MDNRFVCSSEQKAIETLENRRVTERMLLEDLIQPFQISSKQVFVCVTFLEFLGIQFLAYNHG